MKDRVIVVEGYHDQVKLNHIYPDLKVITTNGSAVNKELIKVLSGLSINHQIVLFLDPDYAGEKIRSYINSKIPGCLHAFINHDKARSFNMKKIGIEHAKNEDIIMALENIIIPNKKTESNICLYDLYELGLYGKNNSIEFRNKVSEKLNLGKVNSKTFYKRLKWANISKEQLLKVIENA